MRRIGFVLLRMMMRMMVIADREKIIVRVRVVRRGCRWSRLEILCFSSRPVFVVGMFFHMDGAQTFGFVDERPFVLFVQTLPFGAQTLADG